MLVRLLVMALMLWTMVVVAAVVPAVFTVAVRAHGAIIGKSSPASQ